MNGIEKITARIEQDAQAEIAALLSEAEEKAAAIRAGKFYATQGPEAHLTRGEDGLIHLSQITREKIAKPADVLEVGQEVEAKITAIDEEKQKVSLSVRALLDEAQAEAEAMPEEYAEAAEEVAADAE